MIKKIKLTFLLTLTLLLSFSCSNDDDNSNNGNGTNPLIGVFAVDTVNCTYDNGSSSINGFDITITMSNSGNTNEIALKNITGTNAVYSATVNGNSFTFDSNNDNFTGSGTLQSDGNTIHYSFSNPNNNNEMCNGVATRN